MLYPITLGIDWQDESRTFIFPTPGIAGVELRIRMVIEEGSSFTDAILRMWPIIEEQMGTQAIGRVIHHYRYGRRNFRQTTNVPSFNLLKRFSQMKIITWNVRGEGSVTFRNHLLDLHDIHNPSIMIIAETKIRGWTAIDMCQSLPSDGYEIVDSIGRNGGLWLLWKNNEVQVNVLNKIKQEIHATIQDYYAELPISPLLDMPFMKLKVCRFFGKDGSYG